MESETATKREREREGISVIVYSTFRKVSHHAAQGEEDPRQFEDPAELCSKS